MEKSLFPIRLRGGADTQGNSLLQKAIANAKAHNIKGKAGGKTVGDGNCIFASVLHNINTRDSETHSMKDMSGHLITGGRFG